MRDNMILSGQYAIKVDTTKFKVVEPFLKTYPIARSAWKKVIHNGYDFIIQSCQIKIYVRILKDGYFKFDSVNNVIELHNCESDTFANMFFNPEEFFDWAKLTSIHFLVPFTVKEGVYEINETVSL